MPDYFSFVYGCVSKAGTNPLDDGRNLAEQCLRQLAEVERSEGSLNRPRFPPRLLVLLASPAYLPAPRAEALLEGVYEMFLQSLRPTATAEAERINLIGSTVAGVFFDRQVHPQGALLLCLASKLITAHVGVGLNARKDPQAAVQNLLAELDITSSVDVDPNPLANRRIITFMPGCNQTASNGAFYPAPLIHKLLYRGAQSRIRLVGGVSSANDPSRKRDGLQFAQNRVLRDAVVAASLKSDIPIGVSLNDGLAGRSRIVQVTKIGADGRTVHEFDGEPASTKLGSSGTVLAKLTSDDDRIIDIPLEVGGEAVQLLRQAEVGDYFEIVSPSLPLSELMNQGVKKARERVYAKRPVAALTFGCKLHAQEEEGIANLERALDQLETKFGGPCVGGFFDGELGVDETGRSRLTNGGIAYAVFGDELRERTPLYQGVSALARHGSEFLAGFELSGSTSDKAISDALANALKIVDGAGFPGAMISLKQLTLDRSAAHEREVIIAKAACGRRFPRIIDTTRRPCEGDDILVQVAADGIARYIGDSKLDPHCDQDDVERSGLISQYILPLKRLDGSVLGVLQVDLGNLGNYPEGKFLQSEQARMLDCFAAVIGAGLHRIAQTLKTRIIQQLDDALKISMSASSLHQGLKQFVTAAAQTFGVEMAQLRLWEPANPSKSAPRPNLILETGYGPWFEAEQKSRREIPADGTSPISYAFKSEEPEIVNDLVADPAWNAMREEIPSGSELHKTLMRTQSYAAIGFRSDRNIKLGAVSLGSEKPWYFLRFHKNAMSVLAERLAFLTEHLRATVTRDVLYRASPNYADQNLKNVRETLKNVTHSFFRSLNAEVASLYLWDQDREQYVLRAEEGWLRKGWVDAAAYGKHSGWIGVQGVVREPIYVDDLYDYYTKNGYAHPEGLFSQYMFRKHLSPDFTVEAIGLPLRFGASTKDKFGVLMLYRHIRTGESSGFTTIDSEVLQQSAYNTAGLVNAVLKQRDVDWAKKQDNQAAAVVRAVGLAEETDWFEAKICAEVLNAYEAAEVSLYRVEKVPGPYLVPTLVAGYRCHPVTRNLQKLVAEGDDHECLIQQTLRSKSGKSPYRVYLARRGSKALIQKQLKVRRLVEKAFIPLVAEMDCRAVLVIRWRLDPDRVFELDARQDARRLYKLGLELGAIDLRREMKEQANRNQLAVQTAGIYVFQHAHKLGNYTQSLYRLIQEIGLARDENERREKTEALKEVASTNNRMIDWIIELGQQVQNPSQDRVSLYDLVERSFAEAQAGGPSVEGLASPSIVLSKEIAVVADLRLAKEVFINLIQNALKALNKRSDKAFTPRLAIDATVDDDKDLVTITIHDNGVGMSEAEVSAARRGFVPARPEALYGRHKGVGVLISLYLLQVQKGSLTYDAEPGKGTKAIITLPLFRNGRERNERRRAARGQDPHRRRYLGSAGG